MGKVILRNTDQKLPKKSMVIKLSASTIHYSSTSSTGDRLSASDLVCFSHLRWEELNQGAKKKLSNYAQKRRVFFIEESVTEFIDSWWVDINQKECGVWVVVPHVLDWVSEELSEGMYQSLMDELFEQFAIASPTLWYSTHPLSRQPTSQNFPPS